MGSRLRVSCNLNCYGGFPGCYVLDSGSLTKSDAFSLVNDVDTSCSGDVGEEMQRAAFPEPSVPSVMAVEMRKGDSAGDATVVDIIYPPTLYSCSGVACPHCGCFPSTVVAVESRIGPSKPSYGGRPEEPRTRLVDSVGYSSTGYIRCPPLTQKVSRSPMDHMSDLEKKST